jgi:hypothetical protein
MSRVRYPGDSGEGDRSPTAALSDEELKEVVAEARTCEMAVRAEAAAGADPGRPRSASRLVPQCPGRSASHAAAREAVTSRDGHRYNIRACRAFWGVREEKVLFCQE